MPHNLLAPAPAPAHLATTIPREMAHALEDLGCRDDSLSAQQQAHLDRDGYLLLPGHMDATLLARLRTAYARLMGQKYGSADVSCDVAANDFWHHEHGTRRLADLTSEDPVFDGLYCDPSILAGLAAIFAGPFKLDSINAREALPGHGEQALHRDHARLADGREPGVNTAWLLDDFTPDNGATRVVPGSHRFLEGPESLNDPRQEHPSEQLILASAGSVMIFRNTLWHGGTRNHSALPRRAIHVSFRRREMDLGERAQRLRIRKHTWQRISPAARWILDVQE
jgi:ectoine hydroxylase-related dioxygenase (phytanoyl-CoA dioxygenase family)